jgi:hypothetical protein
MFREVEGVIGVIPDAVAHRIIETDGLFHRFRSFSSVFPSKTDNI